MRFCPKCGGVMMPIKRSDKTLLKCTKCGFEIPISSGNEYVVSKTVNANERVLTTSLVSEGRSRRRSKEEYEQEKEEYYEVFLELMSSEEESGSEE